jgi:3',5'-cyclic AMP phosphodiesterase CpdA
MKVAIALSLALAACGSSAADPNTFRIVVISDTHITGPQYICCTESTPLDNASIQKTQDRLNAVVDHINAIKPAPDLVLIAGDVMHNPYYSFDPNWYATTESAWTIAPQILGRLKMPVYMAFGNHDYDTGCDANQHVSREMTNQLIQDHYNVAPYYSVDHKGWRFLLGNSQLGPTWDQTNAACNTDFGSYGATQLAWVDQQLSDGLPTMFVSHFPLVSTTMTDEGGTNIAQIEAAHPNLVLHIAGHEHRFLEFVGSYPFAHVEFAATRYDDDNFWLLELDGKGDYKILDEAKTPRFNLCSETWSYDGTPRPVSPQPAEMGDC